MTCNKPGGKYNIDTLISFNVSLFSQPVDKKWNGFVYCAERHITYYFYNMVLFGVRSVLCIPSGKASASPEAVKRIIDRKYHSKKWVIMDLLFDEGFFRNMTDKQLIDKRCSLESLNSLEISGNKKIRKLKYWDGICQNGN